MTRYLFIFVVLGGALLSSCASRRFQDVPLSPPPVDTPEFAQELARVGKTPWTTGNKISPLNNGDEFFPAMLQAIEKAEHSITFESFVSRHSWPVYNFSTAFHDAAERGVKVHLILDAYGSRNYSDNYLDALRAAGVEVEWYSPLSFLRPLRYNHRTHRRVLVIDGLVGFTGGAGWTDRWSGHAQSPDHWRDLEFEMRGPVVSQLQENFNDNWEELTNQRLEGPHYFPPQSVAGPLKAQMILGSPEKQEDTIGSTNLLAIRAAQKSIYLSHSYFLPTKELTSALLAARKRGVTLEIIVPGEHTDMPLARLVSLSALRDLHDAGAKIYEYQPTMMHCKLLVIDQHLAIGGSGNLDQRSFFLNDENNLHVLDSGFAKEMIQLFKVDRAHCALLSDEDFQFKVGEIPSLGVGKLFEGQL